MQTPDEYFNDQVKEYKRVVIERFNDWGILDVKIESIAKKFKDNNISNVIVGISGGVDSSVVFGLLCEVKRLHMPHLRIYGYCITFNDVYGDVFDIKYVDLLRERFCTKGVSIATLDCSNSLESLFYDLDINNADKHLLAQSSYALRYQMFFTFAQLHNAVTVGTTNRDEFEYVGWFGKNSDMVVDFQVITDWHKCEVIEAAKKLCVPEEIIHRVPSGDLIDKSSDEENFGCSYDELAYYKAAWDEFYMYPIKFLKNKYGKVESLHRKNIHKYQGQTFNPIFIE